MERHVATSGHELDCLVGRGVLHTVKCFHVCRCSVLSYDIKANPEHNLAKNAFVGQLLESITAGGI
eukprot:5444407-Alexandrium_andersonii.AAC.1